MQRKILKSISKWIGTQVTERDLDKTLAEFDLDSLSLIELIMHLEEEFGIYIDIDDLNYTPSLKDIVSMAIESLNENNKG